MSSDSGDSRRAAQWLLGKDVLTPRKTSPAITGAKPGAAVKLRLVLLSFLMLFVELALIRWLGANIVYLSYYSNFVRLGSFLGIGIGFRGGDLRRCAQGPPSRVARR